MLKFTTIVLGESGAPNCDRCGRSEPEALRNTQSVLSEIRKAISAWPGGPGPNLSFAGAEPFRHPAIFDLLAASVAAGANRIRLESDAHGLVARGAAEHALASGVRHLAFPILGSTPQLHDALSGSPGSLANTLAGVETFTSAARDGGLRVHVTARTPVCRHNLHDTPAIVTAAAKAGANAIRLTINDVDLDVRQACAWLGAACDTGIVCGIWVEVEGVPYGCAVGWELHLASMYRQVEGEKTDTCLECPLTVVCGGAMLGASRKVLSSFAPPPDAARVATRIAHSFDPPKAG